jgi:hypothetical protein
VRIRAVAATIALGATLSCAACSSSYTPPEHADAIHAIASVYIREPLEGGFRLEGTFSLPRMPFNKGWYADWFTITKKPATSLKVPPFLQVGLIRSPDTEFALQPFVALKPYDKGVALHVLGTVSDGSHRIAFESSKGSLTFSVDGKVRYQVPVHALFGSAERSTYLQIGHELSVQDDYAKGSIRDVAFSSGANVRLAALDMGILACSFSSNGVSWKPSANSLIASGKFDVAVADESACDL